MKALITAALLIAISVALATLGCGSSRRETPLVGELRLTDPVLIEGRKVFMANCHQCHPNGQAGLGPALNNKPIPTSAIKVQVRDGMGAMPPFDERKISDQQLDALGRFVVAMRK